MVINKFYVLDEHFLMLDLFYWHADCCYPADSLLIQEQSISFREDT